MPTSEQELIDPVGSADQAALPRIGAARSDKTLPRALRGVLALDDFEEAARRYIPRPIFGYVSGGAETNASLRGNRAAFNELAFVPRVLVNVSERTQKTTLFGRPYDAPFGLAPMGGTAMAAYQGDLVLARAAAAANIPMILSGASLTPLERVREAGPTAWFQAYLPGETGPITQLVDRVARAGYDTLVLTVDVPVAANRENNVRSGFHTPLRPTLRLAWDGIIRPRWLFGMLARTLLLHGMPHFENWGPRVPLLSRTGERERGLRDQLSWPHLELMRRLWKGRLVVKGILDKEDARIARESGADGIIVSNHGGRQLDGAVAPLRVLPGIVAQAGGMTVTIDSGIRRGTDVLKALALGANFVFIGRPFLYAAAIAGESGVGHAIKLLRDEIDRDMALLGITTLAEMRRERLMDARSFDGLEIR
ncbi:MAG: alpha-hydroxy-acid oxidizing enzyme [Betaproteobacteria bacterium RIFCSPLOWO2_12_FULL_62_13]|nr:MAG: alpha-hydroxy-acid oxidizing enzyme [Betaproteobacteria bacterium RIFCSPLOWO2_12_FULL_62_13]